MSTKIPVANGFVENKGTFTSVYHEESSSNDVTASTHQNFTTTTETVMKEDDYSVFQRLGDGLPLQFEDFSVLSLGKADGRPTYFDVNLICPIGYRSCWHDKITGSLFKCEALEGYDSGPIFKRSGVPALNFLIQLGQVFFSTENLGQFVSQTNGESQSKGYVIIDLDDIIDEKDCDDDGSIQLFLSDPVPNENFIFSCLASSSDKAFDAQTSDTLQPIASLINGKTRYLLSDGLGLIGEIGVISVEEQSSSSAWRIMSQEVSNVCNGICKWKEILMFFCKHVDHETCLLRLQNEASSTSLSKFCGLPGSVSIPSVFRQTVS
ncbi:Methyl-CpG-binding domain-containing protein 9 [Quillaja saponaria]|uniref:Methyl-CpG-binding domain-containing protein 9 n=1 Tax=Quillaja saponaria TaxID=32244 RepID=A0AAD7M6F5_QUISA|nr:Methyl-CpG-binding domain-containing protein 9 [Quillaja saponaria]